MGLPNSGLFLSEKDLGVMEFNFLSSHTLEFQDHELEQLEQKQEEQKEKCEIIGVSSLELKRKRPSLGEFADDNEDDGFKTPTSLDQRIPLIPQCPPAPRKPKSVPSTKRRSTACRRILLDLSNEIESLFPPVLLADLGGKIKKVRNVNGTK